MRLPAARIRLRTLIILIAVCAVTGWVGLEIWGDKTERWISILVSDRSEARRQEAVFWLIMHGGRIDPERDVPTLTAALKDPNLRVRRCVLTILDSLAERSESAVEALVEALKNENEEVADDAIQVLGYSMMTDRLGQIVTPALVVALEDKSTKVRLRSARTLVRWGAGERGVSAMVEILRDPGAAQANKTERIVNRRTAANVLEKIGPAARDAIPALIEATKNDDPLLRVHAACALLEIGERDAALPVLRAARADPDSQASSVANRALNRIEAEKRPST